MFLATLRARPEEVSAALLALIIGRNAVVHLSKYKFSLLGLLIVFVMIVTSAGETFAEDQGQLVYRVWNTEVLFSKSGSS